MTNTQNYAVGERNGGSKLTKEDVLEIRNMYASGHYTQVQISEEFNVNQRTISHVINRTTWKHVEGKTL